MKIERKQHGGYIESDGNSFSFGKWQFLLSNRLHTISLIELPNYYKDGLTQYEIYQTKGNTQLFEDVERSASFIKMLNKAINYLEGLK